MLAASAKSEKKNTYTDTRTQTHKLESNDSFTVDNCLGPSLLGKFTQAYLKEADSWPLMLKCQRLPARSSNSQYAIISIGNVTITIIGQYNQKP